MGQRAKHDLAPLIRLSFVRALDLIEKDSGKTLPEMMRDCIEQQGLLPVLDRLSKFTVKERNTTHVSKPAIMNLTSSAIEQWIEETRHIGRDAKDTVRCVQDGTVSVSAASDTTRIQ